MLSLTLACLIALPLQVEPAPADEMAALLSQIESAADALAGAQGYTYKQTTREAAGGGRRGGEAGRGADGAGEPAVLVGEVVLDQPVHFVRGDTEAWRRGESLLYRQADAEAWTRYVAPTRGESRGGRGGRGAGGRGGPDRAQRELQSLQSSELPHQLLSSLASKVADVSRTEEEGRVVFSGTLTQDGARAFGAGNPGGGRRGAGMQSSGTFRITLVDGALAAISADTVLSGSFGERSFERQRGLEIELSRVDATEVDVPTSVTEAFSEPADESPEDEPERTDEQ